MILGADKITPSRNAGRPLVIGLVNNMSVAAMVSTRAQFTSLISGIDCAAKLVCFTMRTDAGELRSHQPIEAIPDCPIDALIVTGMEPTTADLREEWLWGRLTRLHDWCERNSVPVIWSCLAAHLVILHRDGIVRQRQPSKISGIFGCTRTSARHWLTDTMPTRWHCPHSRYNGLPEEKLAANGYAILSRAEYVGVDIFTREGDVPFLYFQGHPEYQADTLLREYLRDMRRYLAGESENCPAIPSGYLDHSTEELFDGLQNRALSGDDVLPQALSGVTVAGFKRDWSETALKLYANWLDMVAEHTARRSRPWWQMTTAALPAMPGHGHP